jgi:hypothetical protein
MKIYAVVAPGEHEFNVFVSDHAEPTFGVDIDWLGDVPEYTAADYATKVPLAKYRWVTTVAELRAMPKIDEVILTTEWLMSDNALRLQEEIEKLGLPVLYERGDYSPGQFDLDPWAAAQNTYIGHTAQALTTDQVNQLLADARAAAPAD